MGFRITLLFNTLKPRLISVSSSWRSVFRLSLQTQYTHSLIVWLFSSTWISRRKFDAVAWLVDSVLRNGNDFTRFNTLIPIHRSPDLFMVIQDDPCEPVCNWSATEPSWCTRQFIKTFDHNVNDSRHVSSLSGFYQKFSQKNRGWKEIFSFDLFSDFGKRLFLRSSISLTLTYDRAVIFSL